MATFLIGYDVEDPDPRVTRNFLVAARGVHEELDVPASFFIVGRTLRQSPEQFARFVEHPLFDLQQHTETHLRLKTVYQQNEDGVTVFRGGSPEAVRADVAAAQHTFQDLLGFRPIGLTGPFNYYRGLCDRPDLVEIVHAEGIRFLRCWGRDERDWQPTPFFAPFPLVELGFGDVFEFGIHGWQDCIRRREIGWANLDGYFALMREDIDRVVAADGVFSYCQHDWSSVRDDPDLTLTRRILAHAQEQGMRVVSYVDYYADLAAGPDRESATRKEN